MLGNPMPSGQGVEKIKVNEPPFETSLERGRYAQIISLANKHTFNVDDFAAFVKPDVAWFDGHYYPAFPPAMSLLLVPAFLLGQKLHAAQLFVFFNTALISLLVVILIIKIGKMLNLSGKTCVFSALCYGLASVAWPYSVSLSAHPLSAFLLCLGFYIYLTLKNNQQIFLKIAIIWFIFGLNLFIDYPNLAIMLPLIVFTILSQWKIFYDERDELQVHPSSLPFLAAASILPILALFISYNLIHYNKPIAFTNTYNLQLIQRYGLKTTTLTNDIFLKMPYSSRFTFKNFLRGVNVLLISLDRGLFIFSPVFLLSVLGFIIAVRKRQLAFFVMALTVAADIVVYAAFDDPWGGWSFGPRYLIVALPFMSLAAGLAFDYLVKISAKFKILIIVLFLISTGVALLGALTTNAVPPSIEAPAVHLKDNFFYNLDYLTRGSTSSFFYNLFLAKFFSPLLYFLILLIIISVFAALLII